jgi:hypothetical protein
MQLTDLRGSVLRTVKTTKNQQVLKQPLDLQDIKAGIYLLKVRTGDKQMVKRIVKLQ